MILATISGVLVATNIELSGYSGAFFLGLLVIYDWIVRLIYWKTNNESFLKSYKFNLDWKFYVISGFYYISLFIFLQGLLQG